MTVFIPSLKHNAVIAVETFLYFSLSSHPMVAEWIFFPCIKSWYQIIMPIKASS